jgi:hypothetical protein
MKRQSFKSKRSKREMTMTKEQMEYVWSRRDCHCRSHLSIWVQGSLSRYERSYNGWHAVPGTPRNTTPGEAALRFRRAITSGHGFPPWSKTQPRDIEPSDELKARYKKDCPNNYKALIAAFGQTRTKYDAPYI